MMSRMMSRWCVAAATLLVVASSLFPVEARQSSPKASVLRPRPIMRTVRPYKQNRSQTTCRGSVSV